MVVAVIVFPSLVTGGIEKTEKLSADQVMEQLQMPTTEESADPMTTLEGAEKPAEPDASAPAAAEEDPMKALLDATAKDGKK